ncbi:MAG: carbohydrate binding family 9 domain-containing protein [Betaproteobacteria bacterium]|nr:carbohydrate binding family 9 domain-containing protein [Betaproteobacteria bacterium]
MSIRISQEPSRLIRQIAMACIAAAIALAAAAQTPAERRNPPITATALLPGESINIDGKLDDAVWQRIKPITEFYEYRPGDALPAKFPTEARIAYGEHALYIGITAIDPQPARIDAPLVRRDQVLGTQDFVAIHIDPLGTRKFAQIFRVNAAGAIGDGLFNDATASEDLSPDFEFEARTAVNSTGWTAEIRIPFSTLRYSSPPSPNWSIQIVRLISRDQEYRLANARIPRNSNCFLCYAQTLEGMTNLPVGTEFTVTPQMTLRHANDRHNDGPRHGKTDLVAGVDVKFRPRPDLVFDATINPDFSQVELDAPQLGGSAQFALFFPEKRPFFLEGADILSSPFTGAIYTRSINDPAWGARLTRRNETNDFTILTARDDGKGFILLPGPLDTGYATQETKSQATIGRFRSHLGNLSVGGLVTDRTYESAPGNPAAYNRVAGVDFVWRPAGETRVRGQLLGSFTKDPRNPREPVTPDNDYAAMGDYDYRDATWGLSGGVEQVGRGFRADNGFFGQAGYTNARQEIQRRWNHVGPFHEVSPFVNLVRTVDDAGNLLYRQAVPGIFFATDKNTNIAIEWRPNTRVRIRNEGDTLKRDQVFASIETSPGTWLSRLFVETAIGDRADIVGNVIRRGYYIGANATLRLSDRFEIEPRIDESVMGTGILATGSDIALRERAMQITSVYHFTARDHLRFIGQYSSVKRESAFYAEPVTANEKTETLSLVYGHLRSLGTSVYVGATTSRSIDSGAETKRRQNEVFVKISWAFDMVALFL